MSVLGWVVFVIYAFGYLVDRAASQMLCWFIGGALLGYFISSDLVDLLATPLWADVLIQGAVIGAYVGSGLLGWWYLVEGSAKECSDYNMVDEPFFSWHVLSSAVFYLVAGVLSPLLALVLVTFGRLLGFRFREQQIVPIRKGARRGKVDGKVPWGIRGMMQR